MFSPEQISQLLASSNRKQLSMLKEYLENPLWKWTPRPDQVHLHDEQSSFLADESVGVVCLLGGNGCLAGEQTIYDPVQKRHLRVDQIRSPFYVYSRDRFGRKVIGEADTPYIKGIADLYEVKLSNGESLLCTLEHRVLCDSGWRCVGELRAGDHVPLLSSSEFFPSRSSQGVPHCSGTIPDYRDRCLIGHHPCGEQLHEVAGIAPASAPLRGDVHERTRCNWRKDGQGISRECNPLALLRSFLLSRSSYVPDKHHSFASGILHASEPCSRSSPQDSILCPSPIANKSANQRNKAHRRSPGTSLQTCIPQSCNERERDRVDLDLDTQCSYVYITSIHYLKKAQYYDLEVAKHHNYEAAGIWNHNSGKSDTGAVKVARKLLSTPPPRDLTPFWCLSQNFEMAAGNMYTQKLRKYIPESHIQGIQWYSKSKMQPQSVVLKPHANGNRWLLDFKSVQSDPLRLAGTETFGCWIDEYCPMETFREVQARIRIPFADGTQPTGSFIYTLTPVVYEIEFQQIYDHRDDLPDWRFYHLNTECNTFVTKQYLQRLLDNELEERRSTRQWGAFGAFSGAVYPNFDTKLHVVEPYPIPPEWKHARGIDFGFAIKFGCIWAAKNPYDNRWIFYDEYWSGQETYHDHAKTILNRYPNWKGSTYADPARPDSMYELMREGLVCNPANRQVEIGINEVRKYMQTNDKGEPRIHIFPKCERLIKELKSYRWHPTQPGQVIKEDDDLADCARYIIASEKLHTTPQIQMSQPKSRLNLKY